ncbi:MAG: LamG domain-containing protein [Saprospiraceae bacterium]|nr:LamG domain-containing protein [Saprospiraceae bacterium]
MIKPLISSYVDWEHPLRNGLVSLYAFNELTGNGVFDSVNNINGIINATRVNTVYGGAMSFNGTDSNIPLGTVDKFNFGEMTVVARIKTNTISSGTRQIFANSNSDGSVSRWTFEINRTAGKVSTLTNGATYILCTSATSLTTTKFHNVAFTRSGIDPSWTLKVYIDGKLDATASGSQALQANQPTTIGRLGSGNYHFFNGIIEHVRVYNRALSGMEINWLHNDPFPEFIHTRKIFPEIIPTPYTFKPQVIFFGA